VVIKSNHVFAGSEIHSWKFVFDFCIELCFYISRISIVLQYLYYYVHVFISFVVLRVKDAFY